MVSPPVEDVCLGREFAVDAKLTRALKFTDYPLLTNPRLTVDVIVEFLRPVYMRDVLI